MGKQADLHHPSPLDQPQQPPRNLNKSSGNLKKNDTETLFGSRSSNFRSTFFVSIAASPHFFAFAFSSFSRTHTFTKQ